MAFFGFAPRTSSAERRKRAARKVAALRRKGVECSPVVLAGPIARSFWGKAWCANLESYVDYANRLPRGRTYVRDGSVFHLDVQRGRISALVSGTTVYTITIEVGPLSQRAWKSIVSTHASKVASVVDLLEGRLPASLLAALADRQSGLFPKPSEMRFRCTCPDWAALCKHAAAVLYGVGARLDAKPELFFHLRGVDVADLAAKSATVKLGGGKGDIPAERLEEIFGIELAKDEPKRPPRRRRTKAAR